MTFLNCNNLIRFYKQVYSCFAYSCFFCLSRYFPPHFKKMVLNGKLLCIFENAFVLPLLWYDNLTGYRFDAHH